LALEYAVSMDMSCRVGPDDQDRKLMTGEAPGSRVAWPAPESRSFHIGDPPSLVRIGGVVPDTGCVASRLLWPLEEIECAKMFGP
jgi:hypothetical protein